MGTSKVIFKNINGIKMAVIDKWGQQEIVKNKHYQDCVLINVAEEIHNLAWEKQYQKSIPSNICLHQEKTLFYFKEVATNYYHLNWYDSQNYDSGKAQFFCQELGDFTILEEFLNQIKLEIYQKKKVIINCVYGMSRSFTFSLILRIYLNLDTMMPNDFEQLFQKHLQTFPQCGPTNSLKQVAKLYFKTKIN